MAVLKSKLDDIQKKAKERTVKTQTIEYDLETLVKKIDKNIIKLNPDYQRKHRWEKGFSSRLIESLILNIPVPLIYLSQDVDVDEEVEEEVSRYSVIDGQQRLTAIYEFFKNEYPLEELDVLSDLNGSYYRDLPPFLIRRLEERTIRCLRIDSTVDGQVRYDIFERLNSGSVKLEAQELRNATCRGPFKQLIKRLAKNEDFTETCQIKAKSKRVDKMEDEELVLRFFALHYKNGYTDYKGGFKSFLTKKMEDFNKLDSSSLLEMEKIFLETFKVINEKLRDKPFSKYKIEKEALKRMSTFNLAVFDSIAIPIAANPHSTKINDTVLDKLFYDKKYFASVEGSTNDVSKVNYRIERGMELFN